MKTFNLENYNIGGPGSQDAHSERYLANGKRVTREQYNEIKRVAVRHDCFSNSNQGGVMHFYSVAHVAAQAHFQL